MIEKLVCNYCEREQESINSKIARRNKNNLQSRLCKRCFNIFYRFVNKSLDKTLIPFVTTICIECMINYVNKKLEPRNLCYDCYYDDISYFLSMR